MCLMPWAQRKKWIPIGSMGCVHTHRQMLAIKGWGSPSHVWSVVKKIIDNWKGMKIGRTIHQVPTLGPKHDKIWAQWVLDIPSNNILEKV
jgi:hypothetical protein